MKAVLGLVAAMAVGGTIVAATSQYMASAEVVDGDRPVTISIAGCRLFDTRPGPNNIGPRDTPVGAGETFTVKAIGPSGDCPEGLIPPDATGLVLNMTAIDASEPTNVRVFPAGEPVPFISHLNPIPNQSPVPNAVTTGLSEGGQFSVYNQFGSVHLIADVTAYLVHHGHTDDHYTKDEVDALIKASASDTLEAAEAMAADKVDQSTFDQTASKLESSISQLDKKRPFTEFATSPNTEVVNGDGDPSNDTILSVEVDAPFDGVITASASGSMFENTPGQVIECGLNDANEMPSFSNHSDWQATAGGEIAHLSAVRQFDISAGETKTIRLLCINADGASSFLYGPKLVATYIAD